MGVKIEKAVFGYEASPPVFKNLSFTVKAGEILAVLGPNGSGKTTLIKCLIGLLPLNEGKIIIEGDQTEGINKQNNKLNIGYVAQNHQVVFPYSVIEMVTMGRAPFVGIFSTPTAADIALAKEALKTVGIYHLQEKLFTQLSEGERQLVFLARALATTARILVLDEPVSSLDFRNQYVVLSLLAKLVKEKGYTIIMTTHHPEHAFLLADKTLLMFGRGRKSIFGPTQKVLTEPNLQKLYKLKVKIASFSCGKDKFKTIVPQSFKI